MIPIRDTLPSRCVPVATYLIMGINALVFLAQFGMGSEADRFIYIYGLVPAKFTLPAISELFSFWGALLSFFTYMFLHGGFWHFIGNMWFLYLFGDNVEDHLGSFRFAGFYILCGIASALLHFSLNPVSTVPTIGASGAIAGVMGAYFILYPRARVLTLIPIIIIPWFIELPAFIFLGLWFLMQFFNAAGSTSGGSGIAWWAHVGGFIAGIILIRIVPKLPQPSSAEGLRRVTAKKKTPKLQHIAVKSLDNSLDLYGSIEISSIESISGTRKIVNIPWGFYKRIYRVVIPPGVKAGTRLRLSGMGRGDADTPSRGDLYLTVTIRNVL